ncbi:hypothetical protein [Staphylococcus phage VB-SauS-SA2]|nr:hypothetical protein [Staphylococcus phage VB-SauS-SA2]
MANTTLKALKNTVDVIGRVKEVNLELGTTRDGKENIKGNVVVLVEENVNGELRSHDIRVRVYSNKFKRDNNINGLYTGYETVMNEYKSIADTGNKHEADLVHVQGSLELNEYISQDGTKRSSNQVNAKFFNRITTEDVKKRRGPKAVATVEAVVEGIKDDLDQDGLPSGSKKLSAFNVDFFGELRENSKPIIPFEAIVPENLADAFDDLYDTGDTGKFSLKINNYAEEATEEDVQEVSGFGSTEGLSEVKRNFVNNLEVIGGTEAYQEPRAYNDEQIEEAKQFRQKAIDSLESGYVPQETKSDNAFGQGATTEKPVSEEAIDEAIDDLDF